MIITPEIKANIQKWIQALRSGEYAQGKRNLQNEDGFCCLGVACNVFIPEENQVKHGTTGRLFGAFPSPGNGAPPWLVDINGDFRQRTSVAEPLETDSRTTGLDYLNDITHLTFDEIADCLEAVYILEVMSPVTEEVA